MQKAENVRSDSPALSSGSPSGPCASPAPVESGGLMAWCQLIRLPNLFTAISNILLGYLVTHGELKPTFGLGMLILASVSIYISGMVWNDYFDYEKDRKQRPERPLASGRISLAAAQRFGFFVTFLGCAAAGAAAFEIGAYRPFLVAVGLVVFVFLYDGLLKNSFLAPWAMGACRLVNVLLGMSLAVDSSNHLRAWVTHEYVIAFGIGLYIVGVTWFARRETEENQRWPLMVGIFWILVGLGVLATVPVWVPEDLFLHVKKEGWYLLWGVLTLLITRRAVVALIKPKPRQIQLAVKHCILSIIIIDAAVTLAFAELFFALGIVLLIAPMVLFGQWFKST